MEIGVESKAQSCVELGKPFKVRGCRGKYVAFIKYKDFPEFRAVKVDSEMGQLVLRSVEEGNRALLYPFKTRIWNESRQIPADEVLA